ALKAVETEGLAQLEAACDLASVRDAERHVLGKRSELSRLHTLVGRLPSDQRREVGAWINSTRRRLRERADALAADYQQAAPQARAETERLDLTEFTTSSPQAPLGNLRGRGHLNLVTQTRAELEDTFVAMGYAVAEGPEAETDWYNFEALNMPPAHPA